MYSSYMYFLFYCNDIGLKYFYNLGLGFKVTVLGVLGWKRKLKV